MLNKPFAIPHSTAVFTSKYVIEDKNLITYVSHDLEDGAWQFHSDDELADPGAEARVVALHEILSLDSSLKALCGLPLGYSATWNNRVSRWELKRKK